LNIKIISVPINYDVVILGGGPGGASAAISLAQKGYSVAVIEKTSFSNVRIGETIPPEISTCLNELSISKDIFNEHLPSYANKSAWGNESLIENNFFFNPFGNGWHLDRLKFDKQLIDHAVKSKAEVFIKSEIKRIAQDNTGNWNIKFSIDQQEKVISARFLIDATGRASLLIKKQGGKRISFDCLIGIISIHENCLNHKESNYTLVESTKNGWWYSADLPENKIVIAFMTDADLFKKEKEIFLNQHLLKTKFTQKRRTYSISMDGKFLICAANSYMMTKTYGENWLAIGDAAMAYDPLSSTGVIKAIKDGVSASEAINNFFRGKKKSISVMAASFEKRFKKYLFLKHQYYGMEKRWMDSFFWQRRHLKI
jgi:flavin-dependent dehydrogenase